MTRSITQPYPRQLLYTQNEYHELTLSPSDTHTYTHTHTQSGAHASSHTQTHPERLINKYRVTTQREGRESERERQERARERERAKAQDITEEPTPPQLSSGYTFSQVSIFSSAFPIENLIHSVPIVARIGNWNSAALVCM